MWKKIKTIASYAIVLGTLAYAAVIINNSFFYGAVAFTVIFLCAKYIEYAGVKEDILRLSLRIAEYEKQNKDLVERMSKYEEETADNTASVLGSRIKALREEDGIPLADLANYLHIGNTTLSQYETGNRIPSDSVKIRVADFFDVSLDYLMGTTDVRRNFFVFPHEERLIMAYRTHPALRATVNNKLLDIEEEEASLSQSETS